MDFLILLAIIGWVVLSAVSKKKKQEAQKAREKALREAAAPSAAMEDAAPRPVQPRQPEAKAFDPYFSSEAQREKPAVPPMRRSPIQATMQRPLQSQLTEINDTASKHVVEASSISGHAHEETSMAGVTVDCAPERTRHDGPAPSPVSVPRTAFSWNPENARAGLILAEIMGRPKALRR